MLVNSIAGEEPLMGQWGSFWQVDVSHADQVLRQALVSHIITAKHVAPQMIRKRRGLIVEVTENDVLGGGGNPLAWSVKLAIKGLALNMAAELHAHHVTSVAVTPGFLRSEAMLEGMGVTEANWPEAGKKDRNFLESESPCTWAARSRRSRRTRRCSPAPDSCGARGSSVVRMDSPTSMGGGRTGASSRSTFRVTPRHSWRCSVPAWNFRRRG